MEKYELAEKDYMDGMKYKDIADKYETTMNTVKSWKKRYQWDRKKGAHKVEKGCTQNKKVQSDNMVQLDDGTKETLQNDKLTPEQQMFCIYYSRTFNATQSYINSYHCKYETAMVEGYRILRYPKIKDEIERLKEIKRQNIVTCERDIVEMQMKIAFSDIGSYLSFGRTEIETKDGRFIDINTVNLKESNEVDTQLIKSVKEGRDGVSIELADKQKAIDWLSKYFLMHPSDQYKAEFDKMKLDQESGNTDDTIRIVDDM